MGRFVFICALVAAIAPAAHSQSYRTEYKLSTVLPTSYPWGKAGERWAELVKEKTNGRINIKMYPGTSLVGGDQTKEFSAIRQGVIDLAIGSTINWSPQVRQLNLFSLPFLMPDYNAIDALTKGEVGKQIFGLLEKGGVVPLAWGENGFRELSNSKGAIAAPADMKGKKFRVVGSPIFIDTFSALGANPTQMSFADAQPALSTGAVDGQENPLSVFVGAKMWTLNQKFLTLWGYTADPLIFVVNKEVWESWTPADRQAVQQAAIQAGAENVIEARKGIAGNDTTVLKQIEGQGVTVTRLTADQRKAFQAASKPVYDKWAEQIGRDLVKAAEASIGKR
ncbi:MAG: TRAP-type transport system periplasmic protein [Betaproteobacteria bacterium]|jgi:tripartite ATP-independent transporter DctP family solute receptor